MQTVMMHVRNVARNNRKVRGQMYLILCVSKENGLRFHQRRQSRDRILTKDMIQLAGGKGLWAMEGSRDLLQEQVRYTKDPLADVRDKEFLFLETDPDQIAKEQIEGIVLYHWNRNYPADEFYTIDVEQYELEAQIEFQGSSHERITREFWKAKK